MRLIFLITLFIFFISNAYSQQTFNKLNVNQFKVINTTKGSHPCPSMTDVQMLAISSPVDGDCVHNTTLDTWLRYSSTSLAWEEMGGGGGISDWETATTYEVGDVVIESLKIYQALTNHTSGTFATDLAANRWQEISNSISAKSENNSSVELKEIQVPNNQLTVTATNKYLVESGNGNLLSNPSYEHTTATTSWTTTGCSAASETTNLVHGLKSVALTCSSQTLSHSQDSTLYASQFESTVQGIARIRVKSNVSGVFVCSRKAGVTSATTSNECIAVSSSNTWGIYKIPFPLGSTSNGIDVVSSGNITGTIYVDDAKLEAGDIFDTQPVISPWISYTPTFTGFGTVTVQNFRYRQVGDAIQINGRFTLGTTTATEARISLPSGFTSSSDYTTLHVSGVGAVNANNQSVVALIEPSVSYLTVGVMNSTSAGLTKINGNGFASSGVISIDAFVRVTNLSASVNSYSAQCSSDIACTNDFTATIAAAGTVTNENLDWINGSCSYASDRMTCALNSTVVLSQGMNCVANITDDTTGGTIRAWSNNTTTISFKVAQDGVAFANKPTVVNCSRTGSDFKARQNIVGTFIGPRSEVFVHTGNGHGSTNNKIRRFTTAQINTGLDITYADSATLGSSFTINSTGLYAITYCDYDGAAVRGYGVSKNSSQLTTSIAGINIANFIGLSITPLDRVTCFSATTNLNTGDIIRAHTDGNPSGTTNYYVNFRIAKVNN